MKKLLAIILLVPSFAFATSFNPTHHWHYENETPTCDTQCHQQDDDCVPDEPPYAQAAYYSEGNYYSQGSYEPSYAEGSYYSEGSYYAQGSYSPTDGGGGGYSEASYYSQGSYGGGGGGGNGPPVGLLPDSNASVVTTGGSTGTSTANPNPDQSFLIPFYQKLVSLLLHIKVILMQKPHVNFKG